MKSKKHLQAVMSTLAALLFAVNLQAQTIKGRVQSSDGEPIIGATVRVEGQSSGTVTDMDGNFSILAKSGQKLLFTYVGFDNKEQTAKDGMVVEMSETFSQLNEVVVVGYGSLAKKEISSSITQVDRSQFNQGAVTDVMALVSGKISGLNVNSTADANPNSLSSIQVRGAGSLQAGNGPLIVIDGIPGSDLRNISTQDVESITVLKDAGSAAIYGTRGANGVVLITTKHGSGTQGVVNVTYDSWVAGNIAKGKPDVLSTEEFRRSLRGNDFGYDTDWYDEITRSMSYNVNQYLSLDGTTKNGYYGASLNYKKANGLDIASGREEYGGRFVVEQRVLDNWLKFNTSLNLRKVHEEYGDDGMFDTALTLNPTLPIYNSDGTYYQPTSPTGVYNPVSVLKENSSDGDRIYLLGNADVQVNLLKGDIHNLNTSLSYSLQYNDYKNNYYTPSFSSQSYWDGYKGEASQKYQKWWTNRFEWLLNYTLTIPQHTFKFVGGYSWEQSNWEQYGGKNQNFAYDSPKYYGIGAGTGLKEGTAEMYGGRSQSTLIGFFARLNYNWRDMIYASASYRREGSTKFGKDNKWGDFPSISAAWESTSTPGFEELRQLFQSLKLRASYGVTGRSDFDAYMSTPTYTANGAYLMDGEWVNGYAPSSNSNPLLGWEKSKAFNVGVDAEMLNSRLRVSLEYFIRQSEDLLYTYTAPQPPYVWDKILVNVGTTKNTGVEMSAGFDAVATKDFKWTTDVNYSYGTTKFVRLSDDIYKASYIDLYQKPGVGTSEYFFRVQEGGKVGQFWGYKYAGHDEDGNMLVYNKNNEAVLTTNVDASDKQYIGNGAPKHFLSWNNYFKYKSWDLSFLFRGAFGFDIFNMRKYGMGLQLCGTDNVLRSAYLDDKDVKTGGGVISSFFLEKGDYFKLDNVTLGYTFKPEKRKLLESLRVYIAAKNLFTLTGYSGNDPSIVNQTGITPGVDVNSAYPTATQISLGLTIRFH
ncbi:MAG: SusC/RagA family TonB-linked outer membrane protein [Prevotella sp.]|jgi:TonB-linked SusC/RagA family outer membrane protein